MSRFILIIVLGAFITYSITSLTQNKNVTQATENSVNNYAQTKARNVANSTVQLLMSQVADDYNWRVTSPITEQIFDGQATYTVTDETFDGEDLIKYTVTANVFGKTKNITAYSEKYPFIPPSFKGAITANNPVLTNGNIKIDGRNHTALGNVIAKTGSYAVWTTGSFTQKGTSDLGGTNLGIDYVPSNPANPKVIMENQLWPGGYPNSPDEVMGGSERGFKEGTLKTIAQSGINGSQYVTDPTSLSGNPLSGITYLELPTNFPHNDWEDIDITGSGVLIVHNSAKNALMKNLLTGTFKGIIIVDDIIHIQGSATVIGTIIVLTPAPAGGNCVGNSDGKVLYSTEAIFDALTETNLEKRMFNYGFGNNRLNVKHWFE
jgi:hypothetical protein